MANNEEGNDSCMYNANLFFAPILWCIGTTKNQYKNHFKGDIGMANYEKRVEQEAAYPIPIPCIQLLQDSEA